MGRHVTRREFLRKTSAASAAVASIGFFGSSEVAESKSPNEKLNIACIGVANRARANVKGVRGENVVALCDIDEGFLKKAAADFPKATLYHDYRELLERKDLDAVVVSTADHNHAPATVGAMRLGLHAYCEKPLTHTVYEARVAAKVAAKMKVATQMGTQIHATDNYRRVVELVQSGAIGKVHEVHTWVGKGWGGGERPTGSQPVPKGLHWDLWLGPAPARPYAEGRYHPSQWRRWWDFGGGTLGDMACHIMDLPFWALGLRHPTTIEAEGPAVHSETCPLGMKVHYEFPARGDQPPVKLHWYDGNQVPGQLAGRKIQAYGGMGVLFIGEKGDLFSDYTRHQFFPKDKTTRLEIPEMTIPNSTGHYQEWITACKTGSETTCNFDYSGALTEAVLLGNVAFRSGKKLHWDAATMSAVNHPAAEQYLRREYRKGWEL